MALTQHYSLPDSLTQPSKESATGFYAMKLCNACCHGMKRSAGKDEKKEYKQICVYHK